METSNNKIISKKEALDIIIKDLISTIGFIQDFFKNEANPLGYYYKYNYNYRKIILDYIELYKNIYDEKYFECIFATILLGKNMSSLYVSEEEKILIEEKQKKNTEESEVKYKKEDKEFKRKYVLKKQLSKLITLFKHKNTENNIKKIAHNKIEEICIILNLDIKKELEYEK